MNDKSEKGSVPFSIESRILRELGERLVRQPEVALLELVKNAYDADATSCTIEQSDDAITVRDTGSGMTLRTFTTAWMRIGTSSKERNERSPAYGREITGEKGIGRFAVRFLGLGLQLETVAHDDERGQKMRLVADFDWARFDLESDLDDVRVPYTLTPVPSDVTTGTTLRITKIRDEARDLDWKVVRTGSVGVVSPLQSLLSTSLRHGDGKDPGFELITFSEEAEDDLSAALLEHSVLKVLVNTKPGRVKIEVFRGLEPKSCLAVDDAYAHELGDVRADIRFFPRRPGTFTGAPVDGRLAYTWVRENSSVKVFDRGFQVLPYGEERDDWLSLRRDAARNERHPQSEIARKHFAMTQQVSASPKTNWMLRLPDAPQLIGVVEVRGRRSRDEQQGLVAAADREGFVANAAFAQLTDIIRGAVEMIAVADRQLQQDDEAVRTRREIDEGREETERAISEIEANDTIPGPQKERIVGMLFESQLRLERQQEGSKEREQQLEVMSLLGIVGGFMTHEFGTAIAELRDAHEDLVDLAAKHPEFKQRAARFAKHVAKLEAFVDYSELYVRGARSLPDKPYPAKPRLTQVRKLFADYAKDRRINVEIGVEPDVIAPLVPISLYNGIAQNLLTNALKAVTASTDEDHRTIAMRAWNDGEHHTLQVSDTGVGIPNPIRKLVFDPLFSTTESGKDPLGSGMGLGLALVKRGAAAFGGTAKLTTPPPGFATCFEVQFPLKIEGRA